MEWQSLMSNSMARQSPPTAYPWLDASVPGMERGLRESERDELLREPLTAILATERKAGGVHAAPVWYLYRGGELRVITGRDSVKLKNALRTGRATLCVQRSRGRDLRYVTAEGSVRVEPCSSEERRELWRTTQTMRRLPRWPRETSLGCACSSSLPSAGPRSLSSDPRPSLGDWFSFR